MRQRAIKFAGSRTKLGATDRGIIWCGSVAGRTPHRPHRGLLANSWRAMVRKSLAIFLPLFENRLSLIIARPHILVHHPLNQKLADGCDMLAPFGNKHSAATLLIRAAAELVILTRTPTMRPIGCQLNLIHLA